MRNIVKCEVVWQIEALFRCTAPHVEVWRKRGMNEGRDEEMMNGSR